MSSSYSRWSDVKAKAEALDSRTSEQQAAGKAAARERRETYVRGHQLAELRTTVRVTQAEWPAQKRVQVSLHLALARHSGCCSEAQWTDPLR